MPLIRVCPDSSDFCYSVGDKATVEISATGVDGKAEIWVDDGWTIEYFSFKSLQPDRYSS